MRITHLLSAIAATVCFLVPSTIAQSFAITNARIVTVSGAAIEKGTVVVRDGLIAAVGADVRPPADAQVIDASGMTVYPGFFDTLTSAGLQTARPQATPTPTAVGTTAAATNSNYHPGLRPEVSASDELRAGDAQFETN